MFKRFLALAYCRMDNDNGYFLSSSGVMCSVFLGLNLVNYLEMCIIFSGGHSGNYWVYAHCTLGGVHVHLSKLLGACKLYSWVSFSKMDACILDSLPQLSKRQYTNATFSV